MFEVDLSDTFLVTPYSNTCRYQRRETKHQTVRVLLIDDNDNDAGWFFEHELGYIF